jgi:putative glycosyltransferase (TIGR04372 family)
MLHETGDSDGAEAAFARELDRRSAKALAHPLAGLGVRFIEPNWMIGSLGEMAVRLSAFVMTGILGLRENFLPILLAPRQKVVNDAVLQQFRPWISIIGDETIAARLRPTAEALAYDAGTIRLKSGQVLHNTRAIQIAHREWHRHRRGPLFRLNSDQRRFGEAALRRWGLAESDCFVTLHVRSGGYHPVGDRRAARDLDVRSAEVETYLPAIRRITDRGGWVIRMGDPSMPKLPAMARVVDYAHGPDRNPTLDLFLIGAPRFFFGTNSGPAQTAYGFGHVCLLTNWLPMSMPPPGPKHLWLPKLYVTRAGGRPMSLRQSLSPPFRMLFRGSAIDEFGARLVDNAAEDLAAGIDEILSWKDATPPPASPDDERLERIFAATGNLYSGRIGRAFLRRHADALFADD